MLNNADKGLKMINNNKGQNISLKISHIMTDKHKKDFFTIVIISGLGYLFTLLPFPAEFTPKGIYMMAITIISAGFWITECLPIPVTGAVVIFLEAIFGIQNISAGLALIASPINSIIFAGFIMAGAFSKYNLDRKVGLSIVQMMGERTDRLVLGIMLATAFLSMWISNTAAMVIMLPIIIGILKMVDANPGKGNLGKVMFIGAAYAANIGGMGTPAGTPVNPIAIAFIDQFLGIQIKFLEWVVMAMPFVIVFIPIAWKILVWFYPPEIKRVEGGIVGIKRELEAMGSLTVKQKHVCILFAFAVLFWIADSFIVLMPGWLYVSSVLISLLFICPVIGVLEWEEASKSIEWGILILAGGSLALGSGLNSTGVIKIIAENLGTILEGTSDYVIITALTFITALSITFFSSLTATGTTFVPVAIGLALQLGLNPVTAAVAVALAACHAFLLPANTPPNAIAYGPGYFKTYEMAKVGIIVTITGVLILTIMVNFLWRVYL